MSVIAQVTIKKEKIKLRKALFHVAVAKSWRAVGK